MKLDDRIRELIAVGSLCRRELPLLPGVPLWQGPRARHS